MVQVSAPPQLKIPRAFEQDREFRLFFKTLNALLFRLWKRTGGGTDMIEDSEQSLTSLNSRVSRNSAKINALEKIGFDIEIITSDFTTSSNQIIICKNPIAANVTLDPNAIEEDHIHIKRTDAVVNVIGTIDGFINKKINTRFFSIELIYNGNDWSQI